MCRCESVILSVLCCFVAGYSWVCLSRRECGALSSEGQIAIGSPFGNPTIRTNECILWAMGRELLYLCATLTTHLHLFAAKYRQSARISVIVQPISAVLHPTARRRRAMLCRPAEFCCTVLGMRALPSKFVAKRCSCLIFTLTSFGPVLLPAFCTTEQTC